MRVGIVGAGITGLALADSLDAREIDVEVFEATGTPGGVIRSKHVDGRVLELGAQRTRLTPTISSLIDDLGIRAELIEADDLPLYVLRGGTLRRVPTTVAEAIQTDLLSLRGKLRSLYEPVTDPPRTDESVHDYFTRAFGSEVADYLAGPLYGGIYGSDARDMPVQYSLSRALDRHNISGSLLLTGIRSLLRGGSDVPIVSFADGLQTLPRALYERHADRISLESPVSDLRIIDDGVELSIGSRSARFDAVAVTTPAETASELLAGSDPETADALAELTYNPLAVVHLHAYADLTGAGYQVPRDEPYETLGVTWNASLLGRDGVYTCYLGGSKHPGLVEHGVDELGEIAATEFESVTGEAAEPIHVHRVLPGMPAYDRSWDNVDRISPPAGVHLCANYTDRAGIPGRIDAADRLADQLATSTPATTEGVVTGEPSTGP